VSQARAVILAGGTMKPVRRDGAPKDDEFVLLANGNPPCAYALASHQVAHLQQQLFPTVPAERFAIFECGHVVPPNAFLTLAVPRGPNGLRIHTEFQERGNDAIVDDLAATVAALVRVIPAGVVCFFPSFAYLQRFVARAQATTAWATIQRYKRVRAPEPSPDAWLGSNVG